MPSLFCFTLSQPKKLYNKSYFEAARSLKKRSLLGVNEHFSGKADAKRALLGNFLLVLWAKQILHNLNGREG